MNKEESKMQHMKDTLEKFKRDRIKQTKPWKLNKAEREYIESLGYELIPYVYEIRTKTFKNLHSIQNTLIKEIHYASKAGKKVIGMSLKESDKKILEQYDIKFRPVKFKIIIIS